MHVARCTGHVLTRHTPHAPERSTPLYARAHALSFFRSIQKKNSHYIFSSPSSGLDWTQQVLEENRRQGEEDQAFEKRVEGKKAAAKKRATRRSACFFFFSSFLLLSLEEKEKTD
jgi:hypothetical protein